jgi:hypothetical protein
MDKICQKCGEPWDLYGIIHEEGGLEAIDAHPTDMTMDEIEFNGFTVVNLVGKDEIPEGHFALTSCPCCPRAGQEEERRPDDFMPLGEVIIDPDLDDEDRKALAAALV